MPYKSQVMDSLNQCIHRRIHRRIHRAGLLSKLHQKFSDNNIVLLQAPAGFGKSTLLFQFRGSTTCPYFSYTVTSADDDPGLMLTALSRQILQICPEAEQYIGYIAAHSSSSSISGISWQARCADFLHALETIGHEQIVLAVDDCHAAGYSRAFRQLLAFFIQKIPANTYLLLSARSLPGSFLSRHLMYNEIGVITHVDFVFTAGEIRQFFSECCFINLSFKQAQKIKHLSSGWPLGVCLIAGNLNPQHPDADLDNIEELRNQDFINYLSNEVIKDLPADAKQFLIRTAIFDEFTGEICEQILEEENACEKLNHLFEQGLLFFKKGPHGSCYKHHGLFRNYLFSRLSEQIASEEILKLHEMAGLYFASRGQPLQSINHYLHGQYYDKAFAVLEKNLKYLLSGTKTKKIFRMVDSLPGLYTDTHPLRLLARGWALLLLGDWHNAMGSLQKAINGSEEEKYTHIRIACIRLIAGIYYGLDEYGKLASFVKSWASKISSDHEARPEILTLLALGLSQVGKIRDSETIWRQIENLWLVRRNPRLAANIHTIKSINNALMRGRIQEVDKIVENDLKDMEHSALGTYARTLGYYSSVKYTQGFSDQCSDFAARAICACKKTNQIFAANPLLLLQAINALDSGQFDMAKQALKNFRKNISKPVMPPEIGKSNVWKEYLYYAAQAGIAENNGNIREFLHLADTAIQMVKQKQSFLDFYLLYTFLTPRFARIGKPETAEKLLEQLETRLSPVDTPYFKAHTWLLLAFVLFEQDEKNAACKKLKKSVGTARKNQYGYLFLCKEPDITKKLRPLLLEQEKHFEFIASILICLDSAGCSDLCDLLKTAEPEKKVAIIRALAANECRHTEKQLVSCARDADPGVRQAAKDAVQKLSTLSPLPLTVQTLGTFMLKIGDRLIPPGDWKRKMAISLFQFFLMHAGKPITQEKLIDVFMPEHNPRKAAVHIQTLVSHLRQILEPGIPPKRISKYILAEKGIYTLLLPENSYVDAFEFDRLTGKAREAEKKDNHLKAFNLKQAAFDLYCGEFLADFSYDEWTEYYRRHYSGKYEKLLLDLAEQHFSRQEYTACENRLQTLVSSNPIEENAYSLLMKLHLVRNAPSKAVKTYLQCRDIFEKELNVAPGNELTQLYLKAQSFHYR